MNRIEFMQKLTELLNDIPESERQEAISFYNDYFDEAGEENEAAVIEELESPEKVAKIIVDGLAGKGDDSNMEYGERGYNDRRYAYKEELSKRTDTPYNSGNVSGNKTSAGKIFLIIFLCIFAIPIGLPVIITVFSVLFAVLVTVAAVVFGLGVTAIALFVAGIILIIAGFAKLFVAPFAALCLLGAGFLMSGISLAGILLAVFAASVVIPAVTRGIVALCRKPFQKRRTA